jgi:hypothetical protein
MGTKAAVCWLALSLPAVAQTPPARAAAEDTHEGDSHTRTAARTLAAQGAEAFERRDYVAALDLFERAGALVEAPTIVLMQARTLVELRRWVEAADRYSFAMNLKSPDSANPTFQQAVQVAASESDALKPRIPLLKVKLHGTRPAEVWIDGRQLPRPLVGVDNPLDPGNHRIEVREPDRAAIVREVLLLEGAREELVISLRDDAPPLVPAPVQLSRAEVDPLQADAGPPTTNNDTLGWVALGAGAASTLVGVGTGIYALNKKSTLDDACDPGCPASLEDEIHSFRQFRTVSYASFGLGAAGLAVGSYLLLSGKPEEPSIAVGAGTRGAWITGKF